MVINYINLKLVPELKRLIDIEARKHNLPSNEYVVREMARVLGRPELGVVPRKVAGRTPGHLIAS